MARQSKVWQDFYEGAWGARAKVIKEYMASGLSPIQAINRLEAMQRKSDFRYHADINSYSWITKDGDKNEFSGTPDMRHSSFQGDHIMVPQYAWFNMLDFVADCIENINIKEPVSSIIELGSGLGNNLIKLFHSGVAPNLPYFGGEYTKSGVAIGQYLADNTPNMNAKFFHFNHLKPKLQIDAGEHAFIFTIHTIEQVEEIPKNWFSSVAKVAKKVTCVHFEPFGFQSRMLGEASRNQATVAAKKNWNQNMFEVMKAAHDKGIISVKYTALEPTFPLDAFNPSSIAIWQSGF